MRSQALWIVVASVGLLVVSPDAIAAPGGTAPPATRPATPPAVTTPVTTAPPAAAPTPMPVPERAAPPAGAMPVSTERGHRVAQAKKLIWWGAGVAIVGGVITGISAGVLVACSNMSGSDDDCGIAGYSLLAVGVLTVLASTPVWIVGLVKKSKAEQVGSRWDTEPKSRTVADAAHRREQRRLIRLSGPPAVPVVTYGFRF